MSKAALVITFIIMIVFAMILGASSLVGAHFGKAGEMVSLGVIAVILLIGFLKSKGEK